MTMVHWQNKFVYTCHLLGKDQLKGRMWLLKAWGLVWVISWTPWWGSQFVVPVNAEQISLNVASSHQVTHLFLVPQSNLLIRFCTGFTVKIWVEWESSSCHWQNRLWMHRGGRKHILSSVDASNLAAWWLCCPVALWWAQDGSVWAPFPKGCFTCLLSSSPPQEKRELQPCFLKGFNFRESGFFPFFSVLICYRWHFLTTVPKSKGSEWNLFRKMMLVTAWLCSWDSGKISNKICVGFLCSWMYLGAVSEKRNHSVFQ